MNAKLFDLTDLNNIFNILFLIPYKFDFQSLGFAAFNTFATDQTFRISY